MYAASIDDLPVFHKDHETEWRQISTTGLWRCRVCERIADDRHRINKAVEIRARNRVQNARRIQDPVYKAYQRRTIRESQKRYPHKQRARQALQRAVRRGAIERPAMCSRCPFIGMIEAHHPDYSKPYDVLWLCKACHELEHHPLPTPIEKENRCPNGHEYTPENIYIRKQEGTRACRSCRREAIRRYAARKRAQRLSLTAQLEAVKKEDV